MGSEMCIRDSFSGVPKPNSEVAERAKVLRDALMQHGHELKIPKPHGIIPVEAVYINRIICISSKTSIDAGKKSQGLPQK